jgi:hypothetical protein
MTTKFPPELAKSDPSNPDTVFAYDASGDFELVLKSSLGGGDVGADPAPQLGGNLDTNGFDIVSTTNADIDIIPDGTGNVNLGNYTFDVDQTVGAGEDGYVLSYNDTTGLISLVAAVAGGGGGLLNVQTFIDFITPQTYTATPGTTSILVIVTGGGGSSGSSSAQIDGGISSFDAGVAGNILGGGGNAASGVNLRAGGNGGSGSGGFLTVKGQKGGFGQAGLTFPPDFAYSGVGGGTFWGFGGVGEGGDGITDGSNNAFGGGGGGGTAMAFFNSGFDGATVTIGAGGNVGNVGAGFRGQVVVFEFG